MMRWLLRFVVRIALLVAVCAVLAVVQILEAEPLVTEFSPPTSDEVIQARAFVKGVRDAVNPQISTTSEFVTRAEELNGVVKLGARIVPGFRGRIEAQDETVAGWGSLPLTIGGLTKWVNVFVEIPEFDGEIILTEVRLGGVSIPPDLALRLARTGANLALGNDIGTTVLGAARRLDIQGQDLAFVLDLDEVGGNGVVRGVFGSMRGSDMPEQDMIMRYYADLRQAIDDNELPTEGSYLPYVLHMLNMAYEGSRRDGDQDAFTSAVFALSMACGARDFYLIVGGITDGKEAFAQEWERDCRDILFNDRIDSRRHFTTAAAIQAASNRGFAISVGEFKELYDSVKSGGFDFTDIAANNSGIRMANLFMSTPSSQWPNLIARIQTENDVIVPFDGIPQIMDETEFVATYGDIESPAYLARLADIEARIDQLALHQ
ncbi:MAG: hypothetical protein AB3N11_17020 [Arenibacterium sp.]